jgi:hypothetical protein
MRTVFFTILAFFLTPIAIAETEPNSTWQDAEALLQDISVTGTQSDDDWYKFTISDNQAVKRVLIDLKFTHADGNIDVIVYGDDFVISDPGGLLPGLTTDFSDGSTSDDEFVEFNVTATDPETYYILVSGDGSNNSYTLTWTELTSTTDDGFEPNDILGDSKAIDADKVVFGKQSNDDWYSIQVAPGQRRVLASLRFYNTDYSATIEMNMQLTDASSAVIATSANAPGINESIDHVVPSPGSYHLRIYGDDNRDGYALDWSGTNEPPQATANTVSTTENAPYNFVSGDFTFSDSEGDSLVSATLSNLSLGGGTLTHSSGTPVNDSDTLTAAQLDTLVYTPPADTTGSPLATFDFMVNDADAGTISAQMGIEVVAVAAAPSSGGSSGAFSPVWLLALMLIGLARRVHR